MECILYPSMGKAGSLVSQCICFNKSYVLTSREKKNIGEKCGLSAVCVENETE
jgi:hypothetical protein